MFRGNKSGRAADFIASLKLGVLTDFEVFLGSRLTWFSYLPPGRKLCLEKLVPRQVGSFGKKGEKYKSEKIENDNIKKGSQNRVIFGIFWNGRSHL